LTVFSEWKACSTPLRLLLARTVAAASACGRQVGADHIDAVERGLGGDAESVFGEAERVVAMLIWKCLAMWRPPTMASPSG
jgi:hypothetical protein